MYVFGLLHVIIGLTSLLAAGGTAITAITSAAGAGGSPLSSLFSVATSDLGSAASNAESAVNSAVNTQNAAIMTRTSFGFASPILFSFLVVIASTLAGALITL